MPIVAHTSLPTFQELREQGHTVLTLEDARRQDIRALHVGLLANPHLELEPFYQPLTEVIGWAHENVTSVLCSCLSTHALMKFLHGIDRTPLPRKQWGVYSHGIVAPEHPLLRDINTRFDVPHSRYNAITRDHFINAGLTILIESAEAGVQDKAGAVTYLWRCTSALIVAASVTMIPTAAEAQAPAPPVQQLSANPFGLLLGLFNAEYERAVSESVTVGAGGSSFLDDDDDDYVNGDVFLRFYPSGRPLAGFAVGVKAGATRVADSSTYFGFGFDTNWSWLLGKTDNFYVGAGFGLKRLFGNDDTPVDVIPTIRIINIGVAF